MMSKKDVTQKGKFLLLVGKRMVGVKGNSSK